MFKKLLIIAVLLGLIAFASAQYEPAYDPELYADLPEPYSDYGDNVDLYDYDEEEDFGVALATTAGNLALTSAGKSYIEKNLQKKTLTTTQVSNIKKIIARANVKKLTLNQLAYVLATTYHETAATWAPVREAYWLSEQWRKANLWYYPYYGRGFVQVTHKSNYEKAGNKIGGASLAKTFVNSPDTVMQVDYSAKILIDGSAAGWFTGKKLSDYINSSKTDFVGARRIINGTDQASKIAGHAKVIAAALKK